MGRKEERGRPRAGRDLRRLLRWVRRTRRGHVHARPLPVRRRYRGSFEPYHPDKQHPALLEASPRHLPRAGRQSRHRRGLPRVTLTPVLRRPHQDTDAHRPGRERPTRKTGRVGANSRRHEGERHRLRVPALRGRRSRFRPSREPSEVLRSRRTLSGQTPRRTRTRVEGYFGWGAAQSADSRAVSSPEETTVATQLASTPNLLAISPSERPSRRKRSTSSARQTSPRSSTFSPRNTIAGIRGYHGRGSDGRGHLQAHAGVDLIPREIVGLADGLHLRPRILPDRGVLYCYSPERISRRNGVVDGLRLSPCHATHVQGHGEGCGNEQGSEPATAIFRAVSSHRGNIRDDCSVPNGIFSPPPRTGHPVESAVCVSPRCNYNLAN